MAASGNILYLFNISTVSSHSPDIVRFNWRTGRENENHFQVPLCGIDVLRKPAGRLSEVPACEGSENYRRGLREGSLRAPESSIACKEGEGEGHFEPFTQFTKAGLSQLEYPLL